MVPIRQWMEAFAASVLEEFGERIVFIGLQGSYGRGEATEDSDLDVVVIFDELDPPELARYAALLEKMENREKICGFVSGKAELQGWDRADLFQFCRDTTPVHGSLDFLCPQPGPQDARRAVLTGACDLYHGCCHNLLHEKDPAVLAGLYKGAAFVLQAKYFCESGAYIRRKEELVPLLQGPDQQLMEAAREMRRRPETAAQQFGPLSQELLRWSSEAIAAYGGGGR